MHNPRTLSFCRIIKRMNETRMDSQSCGTCRSLTSDLDLAYQVIRQGQKHQRVSVQHQLGAFCVLDYPRSCIIFLDSRFAYNGSGSVVDDFALSCRLISLAENSIINYSGMRTEQ